MWVITDRLHPNPAARLYHDISVGASPLLGESESKGVSPCFRTIPGTEITSDWPSQDAFIAATLGLPTSASTTIPEALDACVSSMVPRIRHPHLHIPFARPPAAEVVVLAHQPAIVVDSKGPAFQLEPHIGPFVEWELPTGVASIIAMAGACHAAVQACSSAVEPDRRNARPTIAFSEVNNVAPPASFMMGLEVEFNSVL
jgi:hypothetical protein